MPRIGIAFSGGGARGTAHIGVLQALLENDIRPDVISGSSAGAIVGALYAAGLEPPQMMELVRESSVLKILKVGMPIAGLTNLSYLRDRLSRLIKHDSFEELERELFVAITNLNTGQLELRNSGPLLDVVVASCSIPLVFKPVEIDGHYYVDGGLLNNLPVEPLHDRADYVIGVNAIPRVEVESKSVQTVLGIALRVFDLSVIANATPRCDSCNILIEPLEVHEFNIFQFSKYQQFYEMGYQAALADIEQIRTDLAALKVTPG